MPPQEPSPSTVGPYRLEELLASGGMGRVYRARAPDGAPVALKLVRSSLTTRDALRRFEREAAVRIRHPNVVEVRDAGCDAEGTPFIVFELLEGETLAERLAARGTLSADEVADLGVQACAGLEAAHERGIVHRDLKPSNLFCCRDGTLKILDFGVAALSSTETRLTQTGQVVGTLFYLSPEQAEGHAVLDRRTDVWSLGAVLYEALCGQPPFKQDTPLATIVATMLSDLPALRTMRTDVPAALDAAVTRALAKDRRHRWPSAAALRVALEAARGTPGDAQPADGSSALPPDEQRVVALLYAKGVTDRPTIEDAVREAGGIPIALPERGLLGLFGGEATAGDEVARAVAAAIRSRQSADHVAVSSGRATGTAGGIAGSALDAAETAVATPVRGVAISSEAARGLRLAHPLTPVRDGVFELAADGSLLGALDAAEDVGELVGREVEVAQLARAIDGAFDDGVATVVWVSGPPGIGKTRLRIEAERMLGASGAPVQRIAGRVEPHRARQDLALWRSVVRGRADQLGVDAEGLAALAFTEKDVARRCADAFRLLIAPPSGLEATVARAPTDLQAVEDRLRLGILEWLLALAAAGPLALVLEDLHWADPGSLALLEQLVGQASDRPLLVVATARPELGEAQPDLFAGANAIRLELRGLGRSAVRRLVARGGGARLPDETVSRIVERSDGNPFFVQQIVGALLDEEELGDALPIPLTVEAALQSRLDHLPPAEKELCKLASVYGRAFGVQEIAALGIREPRPLLRSLRRRGLVALRGEDRFELQSTLLGEVAYRMLGEEGRASLHGLAAAHLEQGPRSDPEEIARHHEHAGATEVAARFYAQAALAAMLRGDAQTVLRASEHALRLGVPAAARYDVRMARADALRFVGRREAQAAELEEARKDAATDAQRARTLSEQCVCAARSGRSDEALALGAAAVAAARDADDPEVRTLALGRHLLALLQVGRHAEAEPLLTEAEALARSCEPRTQALVWEWRGQLAAAAGDLETRREAFGRAAALHRELGELRRAAGAESNVADVLNRVGAYAEAAGALEAARDACRKVGHRIMEGYALLNLAYCRTMMGEPEAALADLEAAQEIAERLSETRLDLLVRGYRARALLGAGRAAESAADARAAAERAAASGMTSVEITSLAIAAQALLAEGAAEEARALSAQAMERLTAAGTLEEDEVEVYLTHARTSEACGDGAAAGQAAAQGRARLEALAATIADPTLRQSFLHSVPAHAAIRRFGAG